MLSHEDIPYERGKGKLIAGFLLSGIKISRISQIIKALELDAHLGSPTSTIYTLAVIRRLKKNKLPDVNGLPFMKFAPKDLYEGYEKEYLKLRNQTDQTDSSGKSVDSKDNGSRTPGEASGQQISEATESSEKNFKKSRN